MNNNKTINKIIYFDRETISNILQEMNKGEMNKSAASSKTTQFYSEGEAAISSKINLHVPFFARLSFLFTGRIRAAYIYNRESKTTISSTEISEFEKLKGLLDHFERIQLKDIENSSTSFRVAGLYSKMLTEEIENINVQEFNSVLDYYDGYDTYRIADSNSGKKKYVRFNNSAFISNYRRNELVHTVMDVYCIYVGSFDEDRFDYFNEINKMEHLFNVGNMPQKLADFYPCQNNSDGMGEDAPKKTTNCKEEIDLYDVLYASITNTRNDGK